MIPARLLTTAASVLKAGAGTDRYGDTTDDWASATSHPITLWLDPPTRQGGTESYQPERNTTVTEVTAYTNDLDIDAYDRVVVGSDTYEVLGPPAAFTRPGVAGVHHLELQLRLVQE